MKNTGYLFFALIATFFLTSCGVSEKRQMKMEQIMMDIRDHRSLPSSGSYLSGSIQLQFNLEKAWLKHPLLPEFKSLIRTLGTLGRLEEEIRTGERPAEDLSGMEAQAKREASQILELLRH